MIVYHLLLSLFSFVAERMRNRCKPGYAASLLSIIHHLYSIYLWFGPIIGYNPVVHMLWAIATVVGWVVFDWNCFVTLEYNRLCGKDENNNHSDIINAFHRATNISYSAMIALLLMLDIVFIFLIR